MSKIEWTGETWNPIIGCDKVSPGCKNCYAIQTAWIRMHNPAMKDKYAGTVEKTTGGALNWTGRISIHEASLLKPLQNKTPTVYFVNSMSDLFHKDVPFEFIDQVFCIMKAAKHHTFQILTKRADRMAEYFSTLRPQILDEMYLKMMSDGYAFGSIPCHLQPEGLYNWPLWNVWMGVSVEDQKTANERIPYLLKVPAAVRFLSCEPLLGTIKIDYIDAPQDDEVGASTIQPLTGRRADMGRPCQDTGKIDWVICGGESGPGARPMHPDWARSLRDQCKAAGVAFFFKQWGDCYPLQDGLYSSRVKKSGWFQFEFSNTDDPIFKGKIISEKKLRTVYSENDRNNMTMFNIGKKKAGRLLDGVMHDEFPKIPVNE